MSARVCLSIALRSAPKNDGTDGTDVVDEEEDADDPGATSGDVTLHCTTPDCASLVKE